MLLFSDCEASSHIDALSKTYRKCQSFRMYASCYTWTKHINIGRRQLSLFTHSKNLLPTPEEHYRTIFTLYKHFYKSQRLICKLLRSAA